MDRSSEELDSGRRANAKSECYKEMRGTNRLSLEGGNWSECCLQEAGAGSGSRRVRRNADSTFS